METETSYYLTLSKGSNFVEPKLDKKADKLVEDKTVNPLGYKIKKGMRRRHQSFKMMMMIETCPLL